MTHNQTKSDKAVAPWWIREIPHCDGVEVWPVCDTLWNEEEQGPRPFHQVDDNETWCEPCEPEDAHFWSVYGHLKEGGMTCLEDFATEQEARTFADKLLQTYPNLQENGLMY